MSETKNGCFFWTKTAGFKIVHIRYASVREGQQPRTTPHPGLSSRSMKMKTMSRLRRAYRTTLNYLHSRYTAG